MDRGAHETHCFLGEYATSCKYGDDDCPADPRNAHGCGLPDPTRKGDWIQTFTGRQYWPLDPRPDDVTLEDIAHHLSLLCRYTGACTRFYSVAEHSIYVSLILPPPLRLVGLFHDAAEAYCNDIARPVKRQIQGYDAIEACNYDAIAERFGLPWLLPDQAARLKDADNAMLLVEQERIMRPAPAKWAAINVPADLLEKARAVWGAVPRDPALVEMAFLERYRMLTE